MKTILTSFIALVSGISLSFAHCGGCSTGKKEEKAHTHAEIGKAAPDFTLASATGETVTLSSLKGKEVVLEWVNFGCPFVKKHYTGGHMQELQKTYTEKGVIWILISSANPEHGTYLDAKAFEAEAKKQNSSASYALVDESGTVGKLYDAKTTPNMYVIDKEGVLAYAGAIDSKPTKSTDDITSSENYVSAALDALLAGEEIATPETKPYGCGVKY